MSVSPSGLENLQPGRDYRNDCYNAETEKNRIYTLILELLEYSHRVPAVRTILDRVLLPEEESATLASILEFIASNDGETMFRIRGLDKALASALATLAEQNLHFHSQPSGARKRKRTEFEAQEERDIPRNDMEDIIHAALKSLQNNIIDPTLLTMLQLRLHAIFVSAISTLTSSTPATVRETLSKMSKLIQLLGVLSNLQLPIIPVPTEASTDANTDIDIEVGTSHPSNPTKVSAPGTHACPDPTCLKTFQKAYDLRIHSRVHANYRPFACPCPPCPATFTRSHDLQRHVRTHPQIQTNNLNLNLTSSAGGGSASMGDIDTEAPVLVAPAVRCTVCQRTFSRRDAFLRHTRGGRGKKPGNGNDSESRPRCAAALGENVVNLPSTATSTRKRASRWDKSRATPSQTTELARLETTGLETLGQLEPGLQSDPNDPFSIFSEIDFAQMEMDLGQLLALPQFTEHIPELEL